MDLSAAMKRPAAHIGTTAPKQPKTEATEPAILETRNTGTPGNASSAMKRPAAKALLAQFEKYLAEKEETTLQMTIALVESLGWKRLA